MSVRVSPISRTAAILIFAIGVFTLVTVNVIAGVAFMALGAILYALLYRLRAKIENDLEDAG